jgi:16S rRNA (guanine966-N2)-methyltransferase
VRIIAGTWRGRPLLAPTGFATRPTADRTREGLFSMLQSRLGTFEGLHVADLFAGTGALGLEALSRGAAHCTFVENDRSALDTLRANVDRLAASGRVEVRAQSVEHARVPARPCDLALLDPPYASGLAELALRRLAEPGWLAPGALVSLETPGAASPPPPGFEREAERRFGKAHLTFLRRSD